MGAIEVAAPPAKVPQGDRIQPVQAGFASKTAARCRNPNCGLRRHAAALPSPPAARSQKRQHAAAIQTVACGGTPPLCRRPPQPAPKSGSTLPQSKLWLAAARRRFAVAPRSPLPKAAARGRNPNCGLRRHDAALPSPPAARCQKRQHAAAGQTVACGGTTPLCRHPPQPDQKRQHAAAVQRSAVVVLDATPAAGLRTCRYVNPHQTLTPDALRCTLSAE